MKKLAQTAVLAILGTGSVLSSSQPAAAIDAALAKKCREMAVKAHPTVMAGSKSGTAQAQREFFQECISKNGEIEPNKEIKPNEQK